MAIARTPPKLCDMSYDMLSEPDTVPMPLEPLEFDEIDDPPSPHPVLIGLGAVAAVVAVLLLVQGK